MLKLANQNKIKALNILNTNSNKTLKINGISNFIKQIQNKQQQNYFLNQQLNNNFCSAEQKIHSEKKYFPVENIRNFNIIAHIDHGKSTLADRLLEITGTIKQGGESQYLDKLKVEKERGITVKAQTASMYYNYEGDQYLLNLIDTPGHIDFHYEVSRSMRSCTGSLLLVDACQGIQAQTLSNYELAYLQNLKIIPVINKIDAPNANPEEVIESMCYAFDIEDESSIQCISAKTGKNVENILKQVVTLLPPPKNVNIESPFKGFLIDSWFVKDLGVILLFHCKDGELKKGDQIMSCHFKKRFDVFEVGILNPEMVSKQVLHAGQVGYAVTNMKTAKDARVGDTFHILGQEVKPEEGFQEAKPMVFTGVYPDDPDEYKVLEKNIYKLAITDPAVTIQKESSAALGNGFRCGFLGLLHMDVFKQRLDDEYDISAFLTTPNVPYRAKMKKHFEKEIVEIENASQAPDVSDVQYFEEPIIEATLMFPKQYLKEVQNLCYEKRGSLEEMQIIEDKKYKIKFTFPLSEIITDFFDSLKSITAGYGSLDYEHKGYQQAKIQKLTISMMGDPVDALSFMVHEERAHQFGKQICRKLKEKIPPQLFVVNIQASVGSRVIAKELIKSVGKNVTAKCYGGDYSRKKKLLDKQKAGKKRMRQIGKVSVPKETFIDILKN